MKHKTKACIYLLVSGSLPLHSDNGLQKSLAAMTANGMAVWLCKPYHIAIHYNKTLYGLLTIPLVVGM